MIAWQSTVASASFLSGTIIQGLLVLNYPDYEFKRYHGTLLLYVVIAVGVIFNTVLAKYLPMVENLILVLHIVGFFAILIPLTVLAPHGSARDVFTTFSNSGAFETQGLSFFVGIITSVFAFVGKCPTCPRLSTVLKSFRCRCRRGCPHVRGDPKRVNRCSAELNVEYWNKRYSWTSHTYCYWILHRKCRKCS